MTRMRKSFTWLCIGLVVLVAVTSDVAGELAAVLVPLWILSADLAVRVKWRTMVRRDERLLALLALVPARAPPARFTPVQRPSY